MLRRSLLVLVFCFQPTVWAEQTSILILGDSLSASYGMSENEGWVKKLQENLEDIQLINGSVSGETTGGGLRRLPNLLKQHQPDWIFIELGGNDGLRGFQPNITQNNIEQLIQLSHEAGTQVLLSEIMIPPNYGRRFTERFQQIFPTLAAKHDVQMVPFFMVDIATKPDLMLPDGIHPNKAAQQQIADFLQPWFEQVVE